MTSGAGVKCWGDNSYGQLGDGAPTRRLAPVDVAGLTTRFTDDPLVPGSTVIKAVHITELRTRINDVLIANGMSAYSWTDATLTAGTTRINAVHITELRTALAEAYVAAGRTPPTYTDTTIASGLTLITARCIAELRAAVLAIW